MFSPNTGKHGPEKTPHLGTFQAVPHTKGLDIKVNVLIKTDETKIYDINKNSDYG